MPGRLPPTIRTTPNSPSVCAKVRTPAGDDAVDRERQDDACGRSAAGWRRASPTLRAASRSTSAKDDGDRLDGERQAVENRRDHQRLERERQAVSGPVLPRRGRSGCASRSRRARRSRARSAAARAAARRSTRRGTCQRQRRERQPVGDRQADHQEDHGDDRGEPDAERDGGPVHTAESTAGRSARAGAGRRSRTTARMRNVLGLLQRSRGIARERGLAARSVSTTTAACSIGGWNDCGNLDVAARRLAWPARARATARRCRPRALPDCTNCAACEMFSPSTSFAAHLVVDAARGGARPPRRARTARAPGWRWRSGGPSDRGRIGAPAARRRPSRCGSRARSGRSRTRRACRARPAPARSRWRG